MLIVDGHLDLAWNALQWNRDLRQSAYTIRTQENKMAGKGRAKGTVAFPQLRQGRVALTFATLLARSTGQAIAHIDYGSPQQAYATARGQLAYYEIMEAEGACRILTDLESLNEHMAQWTAWETAGAVADETPPLGIVLSMEGGDPILQPEQLGEWWAWGLRLLGLTHYGNGRYAGGTGVEDGLSTMAPALLDEMAHHGVLLDMTHCSDRSFWQALDLYEGPVLASHNNCRSLVPHQRQFDDAQIKAIIARQGVIGVAFDVAMLSPGWIIGHDSNEGTRMSAVVDQIDHICQVAGSATHVAIGSDLDGGYGREQSPADLDTIADLQLLAPMLAARGYPPEDIEAILCGNWLALLRRSWG